MTQFDAATRASSIITRGTLSGGISQQPSLSRFPVQVDDAYNFNFSVFDGMSKRTGTELSRVVQDIPRYAGGLTFNLNAGGDYRTHAIRRSDAEQYVVIYGEDDLGQMRIMPIEEGGPPSDVTYGSGVATYLAAGGATPDDLILKTVADGTFIVNKLVDTGLLTSASYTVTRTYKNADVMISASPAEGTYHRARADGDDFTAGYYRYSQGADGRTFPIWQCEKEHINWTGWDEFTTRDWGDTGKSGMGFRIGFQRVALSAPSLSIALVPATTSTFTLTGTDAFENYTKEDGDMVRIVVSSGATFPGSEEWGFATVVSRDSDHQITVIAKGSSFFAGTSVALADGDTCDIDGVGREYEVAVDIPAKMASGDVVDLDDIAAAWQQAFQDQGDDDVTVAWVPSGGTGEWRIVGPWKGGDATVYPTQSPIVATYDMTADDRPFTNSSGEYNITAGAGTASTLRVPLTDRWTRVAAPDQPEYKPDPAKMPVLMVRNTYTGDGTTPATFTISQVDWTARDTGDELTNLAPEMFRLEEPITALDVHEDRLVLGAGPYVLCSEAGNYYNFYRVDDTALADSDRIEKVLPGDSVATVWDIKPIRRSLFVKTNAARAFELSTDSTWTPTNVTITEVMDDEMLNVPTVSMDNRLYVATRKHSRSVARIASSIKQYGYDDALQGNVPTDITDHVPLFFEDDIRRILTVPAEKMLFVENESDRNTIYAWRTFVSSGNVMQQSAWTKYTFAAEVCDMCLLTSGLQLLCEYGSGMYTIEYIRFEPDITSLSKNPVYGPEDYPRRLDCQFSKLSGSGTYNAGGNYTQWSLTDPWGSAVDTNDINMVVDADGIEHSVTRPTSTTLRVTGDLSAVNVRMGITYEALCDFSREYVRGENTNVPVSSHGFVVSTQAYPFRRSGPFTVTTRRESGMGDFTSTFTPTSTPIEEEGVFRVTHGGPVNKVSFRITSENARPVVIPSAMFIGVPTPLYF